ncbi:MAG: NAD(P)-binding domain-containing protein, partial [Candidatus Korarchaeota archaeon]|nr:NAD(P)-binding domain-containing protein [Candidatus Korarchaeota archaeon]
MRHQVKSARSHPPHVVSMRVGLIGLGNMGYRMAERLLDEGFQLIVYNRTRERALPLAERGAEVALSPK